MEKIAGKGRINRKIDYIQATISAAGGNSLMVFYDDGGFDLLPFSLSVEELCGNLVSAYRERVLSC